MLVGANSVSSFVRCLSCALSLIWVLCFCFWFLGVSLFFVFLVRQCVFKDFGSSGVRVNILCYAMVRPS